MYKVSDVFKIGDKLSVTIEGVNNKIKKGSKLIDCNGIIYEVISVAMVRPANASDIPMNTTLLINSCGIKKGDLLKDADNRYGEKFTAKNS